MTAGRKPYTERRIRKTIYFREGVITPIELILTDPLRGCPKKGDISDLMNQLAADWLAKKKTQAKGE